MSKLIEIISIESKKSGVSGIPCKSYSHAKKVMRLCPPDRFIKIEKVRK